MPAELPEPTANATVTAVGTAAGSDFAIDGMIAMGLATPLSVPCR
jgi:hypothetical protein